MTYFKIFNLRRIHSSVPQIQNKKDLSQTLCRSRQHVLFIITRFCEICSEDRTKLMHIVIATLIRLLLFYEREKKNYAFHYIFRQMHAFGGTGRK